MQTDSENKHGFEDICRSTYIEIDIFLENVDSWVLFFFGVEIYVTNKISS